MQGHSTDQTLRDLIYMYRGSQFCRSEKAEFDQCRATPSGSAANPQFCESKVANFLQCYHDM